MEQSNLNPTGTFLKTIPKQHGAWSILLTCFLLGTITGNRFEAGSLLLLISIFTGFLLHHTASVYLSLSAEKTDKKILRKYLLFYALLFFISSGLLVLWLKLRWLVPLGAFSFFLMIAVLILGLKKKMTWEWEIFGMLGLTATAPAAHYCAGGIIGPNTMGLWLLCIFFFTGSIFYVRYLVRKRGNTLHTLKERWQTGFSSIVYHLGALLVSSGLGLAKIAILPPLAFAALLPVTLKVFWSIGHRNKKPTGARYVGYVELAHTIIFLLLTVLVFRF